MLQTQFHMLWGSHLGRYQHLGFLLYLLQPNQRGLTMSFEASWLGTGLPHTSTEVMAALHSQLAGCSHHLFLSLCRARACNHEGTFIVTR